MDPGCRLCEQNPRRRCTGNFAEKYLAGDPLKAKCGAAIRVEVIDQDSNEAVLPESVGDISLEVRRSGVLNIDVGWCSSLGLHCAAGVEVHI